MITNTCENDGHPNPDFKVSVTSVVELELISWIETMEIYTHNFT